MQPDAKKYYVLQQTYHPITTKVPDCGYVLCGNLEHATATQKMLNDLDADILHTLQQNRIKWFSDPRNIGNWIEDIDPHVY